MKQHDNRTSPVLIYYRGKRIGLYCAKLMGQCRMVLAHGAISFPVGTVLTVRFRLSDQKNTARKQEAVAVVHQNSTSGMLLGFQAAI